MDFNRLMQTMRDLDRPVGEAAVQECGDPMMGGMVPPMSPTPPHNPPTLTVNLNAQGMDDIESIMRLMTKVNPDMINQPMPLTPPLTPPPMTSIPSISSIGDLGNLDKGPLKMLPDLDADNDNMPGGEMDMDVDIQKSMGDMDIDGDRDMNDRDLEKKDDDQEDDDTPDFEKGEEEEGDEEDEDEKEEAFGNSVAGHDGPDYKSMSASVPNGDDMHKQKSTYPKVAGGDNPMQRVKEGGDLRAQIRAELLQRLSEAKGAK